MTSRYIAMLVVISLSVIALGGVSSTGLVLAVPANQESTAASGDAQRYNIVVLITDDQRWDTVKYMNYTSSFFAKEGVNFKNGFVSTPVCCPSRASIFTGLYSHNHNITGNNMMRNGSQLMDDSSTIATWLHDAGYRTGLYGKYLNGYNKIIGYKPPGWDVWQPRPPLMPKKPYTWKNMTAYTASLAVNFINSTPRNQSFFLYVSVFEPHPPANAGLPEDKAKFANIEPYRPPSFNEANVTDKPAWVKRLPKLSGSDINKTDEFRKGQLAELQKVDRAFAEIVSALNRTRRLNNTVIIFVSDNGFMWGEHRLTEKRCVYEECIRVPLLVRVPGINAREDSSLAANIDIAPTIAEFAGTAPKGKANGMSLVPLLRNASTPWRDTLYLELLASGPAFRAVRTDRYVYAEYAESSDREFYDLETDPYQLDNAVKNPAYADVIEELKAKLADMKDD